MRCIIKTLDEYVCEYDIHNFKIRDNDLNYRKNMSIIFHYSYENDTYSKTFESTTIGFLAYYLLYKYLDSGKLRLLATYNQREKKKKTQNIRCISILFVSHPMLFELLIVPNKERVTCRDRSSDTMERYLTEPSNGHLPLLIMKFASQRLDT